jgi:hypothetical protein
LDLVFLV